MFGESGGVTFLTAWLYYRSVWALIILWPMWIVYYKMLNAECVREKQSEFTIQFKEMIQSMAASLRTGYSVENALRETRKEMKRIYPKGAIITQELDFMVQQIHIHIPTEQIFEAFAQRVRLEDVQNFSVVFSAAKRSGGDMIAIIRRTVDQIGDKIEVKREIDTLLAAKKYEFRVMSAIAYIIIAYMSLSFPDFMDSLYKNVTGIGVMSVCLGIYIAAYVLGTKLIKIEV